MTDTCRRLVGDPEFDPKGTVEWVCNEGHIDYVEISTAKRELKCSTCGDRYLVRGLNINGSPMLARV